MRRLIGFCLGGDSTYIPGCVVMVSLERNSFYYLEHLKRQWGEFQTVPGEIFVDFPDSISHRIVDKIASTWDDLVTHTKQEGIKRIDHGGLYEPWVVYDVEKSVAIFKVHPSEGFAIRNKVSVRLRSNYREWLTQCKNSYYYEKKTRINLVDFHLKMEQRDYENYN